MSYAELLRVAFLVHRGKSECSRLRLLPKCQIHAADSQRNCPGPKFPERDLLYSIVNLHRHETRIYSLWRHSTDGGGDVRIRVLIGLNQMRMRPSRTEWEEMSRHALYDLQVASSRTSGEDNLAQRDSKTVLGCELHLNGRIVQKYARQFERYAKLRQMTIFSDEANTNTKLTEPIIPLLALQILLDRPKRKLLRACK